MNNIQNKIQLSMIRGIPYSGWRNYPLYDNPICMEPKPSIFVTRLDDPDYSINLYNYPAAHEGEVKNKY